MTLPTFSNERLQKSLSLSTPQSKFLAQKFLKFEREKLISKRSSERFEKNPEKFAAEIIYSKCPHRTTSEYFIQKTNKRISPEDNFSIKNENFSPHNKKFKVKEVYESKDNAEYEISGLNKQNLKNDNDFLFHKSERNNCKSIDLSNKITETSGDWEKNTECNNGPLESTYQSKLKYKSNAKASTSAIATPVNKLNFSIRNDSDKYPHNGKRLLVVPPLANIYPLPFNENNNNEGISKSNVGVLKNINNHKVLLFKHVSNTLKNTSSQSNNNIFMLPNPTINTEEELDDEQRKKKNVYLFPVFGEAQSDTIFSKPTSICTKIGYPGISYFIYYFLLFVL